MTGHRSGGRRHRPTGPVVFVTWTPQWRADRMARGFGRPPVLPAPWVLSWPWPVRYLVQAVATVLVLIRERPAAALFTNPPAVTGAVLALLGRPLGLRVWADCHSAPWTDSRWIRFARLNSWVLQRCEGALFHNPDLLASKGEEAHRAVLSWTPPLLDLAAPAGREDVAPYVVAVLSYSSDEPVQELLRAAALTPDVSFVLTGDAPAVVRRGAPGNVTFPGFVSTAAYERLLGGARAVICLTTMPATMQQGIADALEAGVLGISSDTPTMRAWAAGTGTCVLVDWRDPAAIAAAARRAVHQPDRYDERGRRMLIDRSHEDFEAFASAITGEQGAR